MNADELERHTVAFRQAYKRINPAAPEWFKVMWAERQANSVGLQYSLSPLGPVVAGRFEPADYTEDDKPRKD